MRKILFILPLTLALGFACEKPAGEGGNSSIKGTVYRVVVDDGGDTLSTYKSADKEVFISYGEGTVTGDDRVWTGPTGEFEINNLTPGKYTVFTYSYCETCAGQQEAVTQEVTIPDVKTDVTMDDLYYRLLVE